jgi:hypothetical protein
MSGKAEWPKRMTDEGTGGLRKRDLGMDRIGFLPGIINHFGQTKP